MSAGARIDLLADDPLIEVDLPAWCHRTGHELVGIRRRGAEYACTVRVR